MLISTKKKKWFRNYLEKCLVLLIAMLESERWFIEYWDNNAHFLLENIHCTMFYGYKKSHK